MLSRQWQPGVRTGKIAVDTVYPDVGRQDLGHQTSDPRSHHQNSMPKVRSLRSRRPTAERLGVRRPEVRLEQALRVTDLLLQSGGFGLVAIDLGDVPDSAARRIPLASWFRFQRARGAHRYGAIGCGPGALR